MINLSKVFLPAQDVWAGSFNPQRQLSGQGGGGEGLGADDVDGPQLPPQARPPRCQGALLHAAAEQEDDQAGLELCRHRSAPRHGAGAVRTGEKH